MVLFGKKQQSERKAADLFVSMVTKGVQQEWPEIAKGLNTLFEYEDVISDDQSAGFEFVLAVIAAQIQALPNLLPSDQAIRVREYIIQSISSPDLESCPRETIKEYQSAWDQSIQQKINTPWDGIAAILFDKLGCRSNKKFGNANLKSPLLLLALSEKVLKFGGHWWKAVTEEYELVVTEDENSNTSNLEQKCKAVIYEMLAFGFKDPVWKSFGYKKVADRGIFFDVFISKKKLELERVLRRELWLASFSVILIWYLEKTKSNFRKNFTAKAMGNFIFLKGDGGNICSALNLKTTDYAFDLIFDGSYQYGLKRFADFEKIFIDRCDKQLNQNIPQNWLLGAADLFSATGELLFFIKQLNELEAEANLGKELNVEEEWYLLVLDDMLKEIAEIKIRIGASGERQTFEKLKPFVYQGDAKYQDTLAGMYIAGDGVIKDYIQAHKWFNIAEANGHEFANRNKTHIEKLMTSAQIAEAQKLAREWMEKHKK